eukprot:7904888-Pyramimonas_sp.AAC.1
MTKYPVDPRMLPQHVQDFAYQATDGPVPGGFAAEVLGAEMESIPSRSTRTGLRQELRGAAPGTALQLAQPAVDQAAALHGAMLPFFQSLQALIGQVGGGNQGGNPHEQ